jgi:hypothetical protein
MMPNATPPWHAEATLERPDGTFILRHRSLEDCVRRFSEFARTTRRRLLIYSTTEIGGACHGPFILCGSEIERLVDSLPCRLTRSAEIIPFPRSKEERPHPW